MILNDSLIFNYIRCSRRGFLSFYGDTSLQEPEHDFLIKLRQENIKYSFDILQTFTSNYYQPQATGNDLVTRAKETESLMSQGVDYIYHGVLLHEHDEITFIGQPTILVKDTGFSQFGAWNYYPINVNLGRRPKSEYKLITAFHAYLLTFIQGILPSKGEIILRPFASYSLNLSLLIPQLNNILGEFNEILRNKIEPEVFISRQKCSLCSWYRHCKAIARSQNHLSLIPGVTPYRYQILQSLNINTLESLALTTSLELQELLGQDITTQLKLQAQSILEQKPIIKSTNFHSKIRDSPIDLYFDIEAEPERNLDYLLGVLIIDHRHNSQTIYSFLAKKINEEKLIWQQFLDLVNRYPEAPIFHYSNYEKETIKRLGNLYQTPFEEIKKVLLRCIDLHEQVVKSVILPVENYSLKTIANWLGFTWKIPEARGDQSVCWYDEWLKTGNNQLLEKIISYNQDDCFATYHLKEWLTQFLSIH
jgi:uncharacterized protein